MIHLEQLFDLARSQSAARERGGERTMLASGDVPRIQAVVRAGFGGTLPHAESNINGVEYGRYEWGSAAAQVSSALTYSGTFVSHHAVVGAAWHVR